ncbi:MAG: amino acid ABC transporter permease [Woeseiaceae bacterium]
MSFISEIGPFIPSLWNGFLTTAAVSAASIVGSFAVGTGLAVLATYGGRVAATAATLYIELFRNISFLVLIFFFYFGLPELGIFISAFWTGVLVLSLAVGAYVADAISAGLTNVQSGVKDAAIAFGLTPAQRIRLLELPLALRVSLRPLGSLFVNLILTTSILSTITLSELTSAAKIVASTTFRPFEVYFLLLILYSILTYLCSLIVHRMHRRANRFLAT